MLKEFGIQEGMTKKEISQNLFQIRKKLISRQNSPDIQKRAKAEMQLVEISDIENFIKEIPDDHNQCCLFIESYLFAKERIPDHVKLVNAIILAAQGDKTSMGDVGCTLYGTFQNVDLGSRWFILAAESGNPASYEDCGMIYIYERNDSENAIKWFKKADEVKMISPTNKYNWGLCYCNLNQFDEGMRLYEISGQEGVGNSYKQLGIIWENGFCGQVDYSKALSYYQLAREKGVQGMEQKIANIQSKMGNSGNTQNYGNRNYNGAYNNQYYNAGPNYYNQNIDVGEVIEKTLTQGWKSLDANLDFSYLEKELNHLGNSVGELVNSKEKRQETVNHFFKDMKEIFTGKCENQSREGVYYKRGGSASDRRDQEKK